MKINKDKLYIDADLRSILIGSKLGDGSFIKKSETHNTYIVFKHARDQYEYLNWKYNFFKKYNLVNSDIKKRNWNGNQKSTWQDQYLFPTITKQDFNIFKEMSISDLLNNLDELSLSIWILDDGNFDKRVCKIACGRFSPIERELGASVLRDKFGIEAYVYEHPTNVRKGYLRIPAREYKKVEKLILKNIPRNLDIIKEKLGIYEDPLKIKIKYFNKDITPLCFVENKSDWIDLRSAESVTLKAGEFCKLSLGVAMELPEGYEAHVVPRGSTFKNFGVIQTNHMGVVDESYKGDNDCWFVPLYALRDTHIDENERVCQFRIVEKMPKIEFEEVEYLGNEDRGGFGSTGTK